ncbi:MAG: DUF3971 domain-containing protein [Rhodocyclaceae bacterium]|nr:DUF3971 domain-containing protein [Rhodocyclaceae bacterium]
MGGRLNFNADSITIKEIRGQLLGAPLTVKAATRKDGTVAIDAQGSLNVAGMRNYRDHRVFNHLSGTTPWRGTVLLKGRNAEVVLDSNLLGVASSLPPPFNKSATDVMPLRFERANLEGGPGRDQVRISLGKVFGAQLLRRADGGKRIIERGTIGLGEPPPALPEKGIQVGVSVGEFDVDFWRSLVAGNGSDGLPLGGISLRAEKMQVFDRPFNAVTLRASKRGGSWQGQVASREVAGEFNWDGGEKGRLHARLKHLTLAETRPGKTVLAEEPLRELPGMDIMADSFTLHGMKLGKLELSATNADNGWNLDKLAISSPDGTLNSSGLWHDGGTRLDFKLDVADIGKMLERLGYADAVRRGTAKMDGKVSWAGPPTRIDFPSLGGTMAVEAARGQFNKLDPGVGRLLGILSLQSLPRRITLDFRDIFSDGFAFDSIEGHVNNRAGRDAHEGPAHPGALGKNRHERRDQHPGRNTEPARTHRAGAGRDAGRWRHDRQSGRRRGRLAGAENPQDPFGQIFAFEYDITGSWIDPKVEKLQKQAAAKQEGANQ